MEFSKREREKLSLNQDNPKLNLFRFTSREKIQVSFDVSDTTKKQQNCFEKQTDKIPYTPMQAPPGAAPALVNTQVHGSTKAILDRRALVQHKSSRTHVDTSRCITKDLVGGHTQVQVKRPWEQRRTGAAQAFAGRQEGCTILVHTDTPRCSIKALVIRHVSMAAQKLFKTDASTV
jgi:hypothetical protein